MDTTPVSLLHRVRRREDNASWERFVALYTPMLYDWARRRNIQDSDAADLVQDVFVLLLRKLPDFEYDPSGGFRSWLYTLLVNRHRDRLRRKSRDVQELRPEDAAAPDAGADLFVEEEYRRALVGRAFELIAGDFTEATRAAFREYVMNARPAAEVAAELGLTVNAVYLARARVLARLREELDGLMD